MHVTMQKNLSLCTFPNNSCFSDLYTLRQQRLKCDECTSLEIVKVWGSDLLRLKVTYACYDAKTYHFAHFLQ